MDMTAVSIANSEQTPAIALYVDWFDAQQHPDFVAWADKRRPQGLASWSDSDTSHGDGEYPDIFVGLDPSLNGEGTDSDMPEAYWNALVASVQDQFVSGVSTLHVIVWIRPTLS
jgi:hypothetical protein